MVKPLMTLSLGLVLISAITAWADDPATAPATPKVTLAQVLTTVPIPEKGVVLTVGAEKVTLPDGASLPPTGASLTEYAGAFGRMTQTFGSVTALAPDTMTLFNDQPGDPDLSLDINSYEAFQELAASLSDSQWQSLTSEAGLGLSDLTDDHQRDLFWAQFPHRTLKIAPASVDGKQPDSEAVTDVSNNLSQIHLRLGQTATLYAPRRGEGHIYATAPPDPNAAPRWVIFHDKQPPQTQQYGVQLRADVPNAPKESDLRYDQAVLQTQIPLSGLKTVGDLILRIGHATGLELYADRHYEGRTLTLVGPATTALAVDLLHALTLCITGTFRGVGPAYVLTDDLPGVAALHQIWSEFNDRVSALKNKPQDEAHRSLFSHRSVFDIPAFGDPIAPTKAQEMPDPDTSMGHFFPQVPEFESESPFSALTPAQQDMARRIVTSYSATHAAEIAKDPSQAPNLNGQWEVSPRCALQAVLPGFSQPIEIRKTSLAMLVFPPDEVLQPLEKKMEAWEKAQAAKKKPTKPIPTLAVLLQQTPRRAVLADPHSPAEVRSLVAAMQKLGLNQLWLYVFEDGVSRIPGTTLPQPSDGKDDLLDAALAAAKGTGITVFPVMDLLTWGQSPPSAVQDINVLGETSVQIAARQKAQQSYQDPADTSPPEGMSVNPFAPDVWNSLTALVKAVAARPGIGGLVWRQTDPTGYDNPTGSAGSLDDQLGYTLPARLAFLRQSHADPLDITTDDYSRMDFHLPNWDDAETDGKLREEWSAFRAVPDLTLLRSLYATTQAAASAGALPIIVNERRQWIEDWYGTWDDPRMAPPTYHGGAETGDYDPGFDQTVLTQAKTQSKTALATIIVKPDDELDDLALRLDNILNGEKGKRWDGFVLDIATGDGGPGVAGLTALAK
jgi:hypothetical protein